MTLSDLLRKPPTILILIALLLFAPSLHAQSSCDENEELEKVVGHALKGHSGIPGGVVAFSDRSGCGRIAFGSADRAQEIAMPVDAVFDIGSVHKLFKWVLLERLAAKQMVSFDDPVSSHVLRPRLPGRTISDLVRHRAGLPDMADELYGDIFAKFQSGELPHQYSYGEILALLNTVSDGIEEGDRSEFVYSSYGTRIAAQVATEVTGQSIDSLLNDEIIRPIGLQNTRVFGREHADGLTLGYGDPGRSLPDVQYGPLPAEIAFSVSSAVGGAITSTAVDLLNFLSAIFDPKRGFLPEQVINDRLKVIDEKNPNIHVGRGLFQYPNFVKEDFWIHLGSGMHSHASLVGYSPKLELGIVVLVNQNTKFITNGHGVHFDIVNAIAESLGSADN